MSVGCGDRTNSYVANGNDSIGFSRGLTFIVAVTPETSSTGAVSPMPRATPRITDVTRPDRAVGRTTNQTVRQCGAPVAADASRRLPGTRRSTTSAERMMIGSIMMLTASAAARPERWKPRIRIHVAKMNSPARIDGSAVIAVTTERTRPVVRPPVSLRNTAHVMPSGTVMTSAIPMMISDPAMACEMPPMSSGSSGPALRMSSV
jgi:hypothetical protein